MYTHTYIYIYTFSFWDITPLGELAVFGSESVALCAYVGTRSVFKNRLLWRGKEPLVI